MQHSVSAKTTMLCLVQCVTSKNSVSCEQAVSQTWCKIDILTKWWLHMCTNLSRGDEVALRRASERQLLLGNHHHLGTWRVYMRSDGSWATTCLYPWSTGGHGWSVLIVALDNRWGKGGEEWKVYQSTNEPVLSCLFCVLMDIFLLHILKC